MDRTDMTGKTDQFEIVDFKSGQSAHEDETLGNFPTPKLNPNRRQFLTTAAIGAVTAGLAPLAINKDAEAFEYEPYSKDDDL